jgi:endonuclease/exonuclease/phosphatase family metal-dependent hydrolase
MLNGRRSVLIVLLGIACAVGGEAENTRPAEAATEQPVTAPPDRLRVLVWNIQRGANQFEQGPEKALRLIKSIQPDICLLQESYDVDGPRPTLGRWLATELSWNAYQGASPHLCVLTPLTIGETWHHHDWHAVGARLTDRVGRELIVYSIWIDYRAFISEALREKPDATDEELLACETEHSGRLKQTQAILAHLRQAGQFETDVPLLVGGDWNCPSHLDWTEDTASVYRFRRALPLPVSTAVTAAGFEDTFRTIFPNPVQQPGLTWSPLYRGTGREPALMDRIDRLYLHHAAATRRLKPVAATVLPEVWEAQSIPPAEREFPSDHGALVVDFVWQSAAEPTLPSAPDAPNE